MSHKSPSLMSWIIAAATVVFLAPTIGASLIYTSELRDDMEKIALTRLEERGQYAADYLARLLFKEWTKVESIAGSLDMSDMKKTSERFAEIVASDRRFASFDLSDLSGKIVASSNTLHKGKSAMDEPWFRRGMEGPFIGDLHDDPPLAALVPPRQGHTSRFIEFALPVKGADGQTTAVLGVHVEWFWVRDLLGVLRMDDAEALLLSRDRQILYAPKNADEKSIMMTPAFGASQVARVSRLEYAPDGAPYLTVVIPRIEYAGLPDLGWSLVVRQEAGKGFAFMKSLFRRLWTVIALASIVALSGIFVVAWWISKPLTAVADFGTRLSEGATAGPPPEESGCREARELTTALAALQSKMETKEPARETSLTIQALQEAVQGVRPAPGGKTDGPAGRTAA